MVGRPSEQFPIDLKNGTLTPMVDWWCWQQALRMHRFSEKDQKAIADKLHPNFLPVVRKYFLAQKKSKRYS